MDFYIDNEEELNIVKQNNFEVFYKENKPYIVLTDLNQVQDNSYLLNFKNYTPSTNLTLFQESMDNLD